MTIRDFPIRPVFAQSELAHAIASINVPLSEASLEEALSTLVSQGLSEIPLPARGATKERWAVLSAIAAKDLSLAKVAEGHTDAVAILAETGMPPLPPQAIAGVWAAESGPDRLRMEKVGGASFLFGRKHWCSGARFVSHALVTAWEGENSVAALAPVRHRTVTVSGDGWNAVGMQATASVDVLFDGTLVAEVGKPGDYLRRPGFWQGGAGIAACWYGATVALAQALQAQVRCRPSDHGLAHLGEIDALLSGLREKFVAGAHWIDENPTANAERLAFQLRTATEIAARHVIDLTTRALGAAAYCKDRGMAQRLADLPVFLSQSHAERDWQHLGEIAAEETAAWEL